MKGLFFKSLTLVVLFVSYSANSNAQGFFGKLKKAAESVTKTVVSERSEDVPADTIQIDTKEYLANLPSYSVKRVIEKDSLENEIKNNDGTIRYKYLLIDKDGKVCDKNTAKKHLNNALKSGGKILLKVGGGAAAGAATALLVGGSKKESFIAGGVCAPPGLLASSGDIKEIRKQVKLMKECKNVLAAYEKTFTDEGEPKDATVDLTNVDGINFADCEVITKDAKEVQVEMLASKERGASMEDVSDEDLNDLEDLFKKS